MLQAKAHCKWDDFVLGRAQCFEIGSGLVDFARRLWVGGLRKNLTKEARVAVEEKRLALGYEKTTKRSPSGALSP